MALLRCWVVTDGKAGMESQCVGLAEALGLTPEIKRVALRFPWRQLTPYFRIAPSLGFAEGSAALTPPWPDLVIATGRHSVAAALYIRAQARRNGTHTIAVQLQNPGISPSHFDLVVTPLHDGLTGANVIATKGALEMRSRRHICLFLSDSSKWTGANNVPRYSLPLPCPQAEQHCFGLPEASCMVHDTRAGTSTPTSNRITHVHPTKAHRVRSNSGRQSPP